MRPPDRRLRLARRLAARVSPKKAQILREKYADKVPPETIDWFLERFDQEDVGEYADWALGQRADGRGSGLGGVAEILERARWLQAQARKRDPRVEADPQWAGADANRYRGRDRQRLDRLTTRWPLDRLKGEGQLAPSAPADDGGGWKRVAREEFSGHLYEFFRFQTPPPGATGGPAGEVARARAEIAREVPGWVEPPNAIHGGTDERDYRISLLAQSPGSALVWKVLSRLGFSEHESDRPSRREFYPPSLARITRELCRFSQGADWCTTHPAMAGDYLSRGGLVVVTRDREPLLQATSGGSEVRWLDDSDFDEPSDHSHEEEWRWLADKLRQLGVGANNRRNPYAHGDPRDEEELAELEKDPDLYAHWYRDQTGEWPDDYGEEDAAQAGERLRHGMPSGDFFRAWLGEYRPYLLRLAEFMDGAAYGPGRTLAPLKAYLRDESGGPRTFKHFLGRTTFDARPAYWLAKTIDPRAFPAVSLDSADMRAALEAAPWLGPALSLVREAQGRMREGQRWRRPPVPGPSRPSPPSAARRRRWAAGWPPPRAPPGGQRLPASPSASPTDAAARPPVRPLSMAAPGGRRKGPTEGAMDDEEILSRMDAAGYAMRDAGPPGDATRARAGGCGFCPLCGADTPPGTARERRPNGDTLCGGCRVASPSRLWRWRMDKPSTAFAKAEAALAEVQEALVDLRAALADSGVSFPAVNPPPLATLREAARVVRAFAGRPLPGRGSLEYRTKDDGGRPYLAGGSARG